MAKVFFSSRDWIFADFLFKELFQIFESEDQALEEIDDAYHNDVRSARVPVCPDMGSFGANGNKVPRSFAGKTLFFCRWSGLMRENVAILAEMGAVLLARRRLPPLAIAVRQQRQWRRPEYLAVARSR